jgi:hypothetical protein
LAAAALGNPHALGGGNVASVCLCFQAPSQGGVPMPPKGGNMSLADADVKAAVDYMVAQAK